MEIYSSLFVSELNCSSTVKLIIWRLNQMLTVEDLQTSEITCEKFRQWACTVYSSHSATFFLFWSESFESFGWKTETVFRRSH